VVAVIGFDLSAAFNTVGREDLLPKMSAIGSGGKALKWFRCYLTNAKQRVVWDGHVSDVVDVKYGVAQLTQHLPRGQLLQQLGSGLVMEKLAHYLPVVAQLRLPGSAKPILEALESIEVAINDVARSVIVYRREDHIPIKDLLESAKYMSLNQLLVRSTSMAAWSAYVSEDGEAGTTNLVGRLMFDFDLVVKRACLYCPYNSRALLIPAYNCACALLHFQANKTSVHYPPCSRPDVLLHKYTRLTL
jgi:hypothetical protein